MGKALGPPRPPPHHLHRHRLPVVAIRPLRQVDRRHPPSPHLPDDPVGADLKGIPGRALGGLGVQGDAGGGGLDQPREVDLGPAVGLQHAGHLPEEVGVVAGLLQVPRSLLRGLLTGAVEQGFEPLPAILRRANLVRAALDRAALDRADPVHRGPPQLARAWLSHAFAIR
ncbi:MAG: hypothetical protein AAGD06_04565 [Acidobacteriota bacterium]